MDDTDLESRRRTAESWCREIQQVVQGRSTFRVEWIRDPDSSASPPFRVDARSGVVRLNRVLVTRWITEHSPQRVETLIAGLSCRAAAALLWSPSEYLWSEAAELHVRSEQEQGLKEDYVWAFHAAHQILEGHRLDHQLLARFPAAATSLAEWIQVELDDHPLFDTYPRAAIVMGRPHLPAALIDQAMDDFIGTYGVAEAADLGELVRSYIAVDRDDVEKMVELTQGLVFQAFPDAMGLAWSPDDQGPVSLEIWPFQSRFPFSGYDGWEGAEAFLTLALSRFSGEAGLDYGDAVVVSTSEDGVAGPHVGAWSASGSIFLQAVQLDLPPHVRAVLVEDGWQPFENAPESLHKEIRIEDVNGAVSSIVRLLREDASTPSVELLTLWARGVAAEVAAESRSD